jgi:hypothetical protein
MYTYTCIKIDDEERERERQTDKKKPVRRISLSGTWHRKKNGVIVNQRKNQ